MTVIAYRDGVLAADTLEVFDDAGKTYCSKLRRITTGKHKGDIIGVAGGSFIGGLLTAWYTVPSHGGKMGLPELQGIDEFHARLPRKQMAVEPSVPQGQQGIGAPHRFSHSRTFSWTVHLLPTRCTMWRPFGHGPPLAEIPGPHVRGETICR